MIKNKDVFCKSIDTVNLMRLACKLSEYDPILT
jgi:hypothetical protein